MGGIFIWAQCIQYDVCGKSTLNVKPCIQLARLKLELTNQESEGGINCIVPTSMYVNRKGIVIYYRSSPLDVYSLAFCTI